MTMATGRRFVAVVVVVVLLSLAFSPRHAAAAGGGGGEGGTQVSSSGGDVASVPLSEVETLPQSNKCWKVAIAVFRESQDLSDDRTATFCRVMPEEYQKLLALMIAQCHLEDLGKPLFNDESIIASECIHAGDSSDRRRDILQRCLKHLTDAGVHSYTHYISYVQQLCTRLSQELLITYQREVQKEAADRFSNISMLAIDQLETISELTQRHSDHMEALSHDIPKLLKDKLTKDIKVALTDTVRQSFQEQLERHRELLKDKLEEHISELLQVHRRELEEQYERMKEQNLEMNLLSKTLSKVMQPLLGLESLVKAAMKGYSWAAFSLHLFITLNVVWIISRPQRCHSFRSYLFGIVLTEAAVEIVIGACAQYELMTETDRAQKITELRRLALFLECSLYAAGLILTLILPRRAEEDKSPEETILNDELQDLQRRYDTILHQFEGDLRLVRSRDVERRLLPQVDPVATSVIVTPSASGPAYRQYRPGLTGAQSQYPARLDTTEQQEEVRDASVEWGPHYHYSLGSQGIQLRSNGIHFHPSGPQHQHTLTSNIFENGRIEKYHDAVEEASLLPAKTRFVPADTPSVYVGSTTSTSESNYKAASRKRPAEALQEETPEPKRSKSEEGCL